MVLTQFEYDQMMEKKRAELKASPEFDGGLPPPQQVCVRCQTMFDAQFVNCTYCDGDPPNDSPERRHTTTTKPLKMTFSDNTKDVKTNPVVDHPPHYNQGGIECIDAIKAALTPEEFRGFCKGNALKYVWRERYKNGGVDLEKSNWYLLRLLASGES